MKIGHRLFRLFYRLGIMLTLGVGSVLVWVGCKAADIVMLPRRTPQDPYHKEVVASPEKFGFHMHALEVPREPGVVVKALYLQALPGKRQARGTEFMKTLAGSGRQELLSWKKPRGTLVLLHGRNSIKEHWFPVAEKLCSMGYNLVLMDSRGHGDSVGGYCTYGVMEAGDVKAVTETVAKKFGNLQPMGIMGYSLGGAIAAHLVASDPEFKAVTLVSVFSNLNDVTQQAGKNRYGSMASVLLPAVRAKVKWTANFDMADVSPAQDARQIHIPALVIHGGKDQFIAPSQGRAIYDALDVADKQWLLIPEGSHADVFGKGGDALVAKIGMFFAERLR